MMLSRRLVWTMMLGGIIGVSLCLPLLFPSDAMASATDGAFQIAMAGQVSASSPSSPDTQGNCTVTISQAVQTTAGQFPAVQLQMDVVEQLSAQKSGTLSGTATLTDMTGQTPIFSAVVTGTIDTTGLTLYHVSQARAATGTGGILTWTGALRSSPLGALTATAQGVLRFPAGVPAHLVATIWPGARSAPAVGDTSTTTANAKDPTLWYLTRAAGNAAYVLLAITMITGIAISTQALDSVIQRWRILDLHQFVTALTLALIVVHLVTLMLYPFLPYGLVPLLLPIAEPYRPVAVASGIIGLYVFVVVTLSSWLRQRLSYGLWRKLHYASVPMFVLLTAHSIFAGTDTPIVWMVLVYVTSSMAIIAITGLRILQALVRRQQRLHAAPARR